MKPIKIFSGYDSNINSIANVLTSSILRRATIPVEFTYISLKMIQGFFKRKVEKDSSTEFSISRFLTPYLSSYEGLSIFMDNDIIVTQDIKDLVNLYDPKYAIQVVKHEYEPKNKIKFLGNEQYVYPKKNWSSVILFNNTKCRALTPEVVEKKSGKFLHRFEWLEDDSLIGEIPLDWNFLVDEYEKPKERAPSLLHYTVGGPYFKEYKECDYNKEWNDEMNYMNKSVYSYKKI